MLPYYKVGPFWAVCEKKKYERERCLWNEAAKNLTKDEVTRMLDIKISEK